MSANAMSHLEGDEFDRDELDFLDGTSLGRGRSLRPKFFENLEARFTAAAAFLQPPPIPSFSSSPISSEERTRSRSPPELRLSSPSVSLPIGQSTIGSICGDMSRTHAMFSETSVGTCDEPSTPYKSISRANTPGLRGAMHSLDKIPKTIQGHRAVLSMTTRDVESSQDRKGDVVSQVMTAPQGLKHPLPPDSGKSTKRSRSRSYMTFLLHRRKEGMGTPPGSPVVKRSKEEAGISDQEAGKFIHSGFTSQGKKVLSDFADKISTLLNDDPRKMMSAGAVIDTYRQVYKSFPPFNQQDLCILAKGGHLLKIETCSTSEGEHIALRMERNDRLLLHGYHSVLQESRLRRFMEKYGTVGIIEQWQNGSAFVEMPKLVELKSAVRSLDSIVVPMVLRGHGQLGKWFSGKQHSTRLTRKGECIIKARHITFPDYTAKMTPVLKEVALKNRARGKQMDDLMIQKSKGWVPAKQCQMHGEPQGCAFGRACLYHHNKLKKSEQAPVQQPTQLQKKKRGWELIASGPDDYSGGSISSSASKGGSGNYLGSGDGPKVFEECYSVDQRDPGHSNIISDCESDRGAASHESFDTRKGRNDQVGAHWYKPSRSSSNHSGVGIEDRTSLQHHGGVDRSRDFRDSNWGVGGSNHAGPRNEVDISSSPQGEKVRPQLKRPVIIKTLRGFQGVRKEAVESIGSLCGTVVTCVMSNEDHEADKVVQCLDGFDLCLWPTLVGSDGPPLLDGEKIKAFLLPVSGE